MTIKHLPPEIEPIITAFRTCEFSTLAKDGTPITWPVTTVYRPREGRFLVATSPGLPQKALNIRRNPRVSMLFSDPTGSGLVDPPAILIQGDAEAPDEIGTTLDYEDLTRLVIKRKRITLKEIKNPLHRLYFDWYYLRLPIYVTPRRVLLWKRGDFTQSLRELEV